MYANTSVLEQRSEQVFYTVQKYHYSHVKD